MGIKIKDNNEDRGLEYAKQLLQGMAITLFSGVFLLIVMWVVLALMMAITGGNLTNKSVISGSKEAQDIILEIQKEEGKNYTSVVKKISIKDGEIYMENGDIIKLGSRDIEPQIGNVISYMKVDGYYFEPISLSKKPKKTGEKVYIELEIIGRE